MFVVNVMKLIEGSCFLCGKLCEEYVHFECAMAYSDEKRESLKNERQEERLSKKSAELREY